LFYAATPIGSSETDYDLFASSGLILTEAPSNGQTAQVIKEALGAVAFARDGRMVRLGSNDAAVVRDDPLPNGVSTFHVYWSDGTNDYVIVTSTEPEAAVDFGRSFYCS
jgi:hypothetical protein